MQELKQGTANIYPRPHEVNAIVPFTTEDGGEGTQILTSSGACITKDNRTAHYIVRQYAEGEDKALRLIGHHYAPSLGSTHAFLLPISLELTLVGLKYRTPGYSSHHRTWAYINIDHVERLYADPETKRNSYIELTGGKTLHLLWSVSTVRQKLVEAQYIHLRQLNQLRLSLKRIEAKMMRKGTEPGWLGIKS